MYFICEAMMSITNHLAYLSKQCQSLSKKSNTPSPLLVQCQHLMTYIQSVPKKSGLLEVLFEDIKKHSVKDFPLFMERLINNFKSDVHLALVDKQVNQFKRHKNLYRVSNIFIFMGTVEEKFSDQTSTAAWIGIFTFSGTLLKFITNLLFFSRFALIGLGVD